MDAFSSRANLPAPNNQRPGHAEFRGPGLVAGTLVTTPDGDKKIEDIVAGDLVLSGVGGGETDFFEVAKLIKNHHQGPILFINATDKYQLRVAPDHVCFVDIHQDSTDFGSIEIDAFKYEKTSSKVVHFIRIDAEIVGQSNNLDEAEEIALRQSLSNGGAKIERFANFGQDHFYRFMAASQIEVGLMLPAVRAEYQNQVVNKRLCNRPEIPVPQFGIIYNEYKKLIVEDWEAQILSIEEEPYDGLIYTLNVPETRNFAANGILVHDSTPIY